MLADHSNTHLLFPLSCPWSLTIPLVNKKRQPDWIPKERKYPDISYPFSHRPFSQDQHSDPTITQQALEALSERCSARPAHQSWAELKRDPNETQHICREEFEAVPATKDPRCQPALRESSRTLRCWPTLKLFGVPQGGMVISLGH